MKFIDQACLVYKIVLITVEFRFQRRKYTAGVGTRRKQRNKRGSKQT